MAAETPKTITVLAPAKINRSLQVMGVRPDGYHELRTVFQSITLHDTLTVRVTRGPFRLTCSDPACPADERNLVWRAAAELWAASAGRGRLRNVSVHLAKRIPMQAGLGGGSSDAAAALRALSTIWRTDPAAVADVARSLGADVPYFLEGGTVLGLDRGDLLFPLADLPPAWVVLVLPGFGVSTKDAFGWWDQARAGKKGSGLGRGSGLANDLEALVAKRHPEVARFVRALERLGASQAAMSGSGSAVFGLFERRSDATRAVLALGEGPRVVLARTTNRVAYQRLAGIAAHRINLPFAPRGSGHS